MNEPQHDMSREELANSGHITSVAQDGYVHESGAFEVVEAASEAQTPQTPRKVEDLTQHRRGFLSTVGAIMGVVAVGRITGKTTAKAEEIRSGTPKKEEAKEDTRPMVRAMQWVNPEPGKPGPGSAKMFTGRLVGKVDKNSLTKEQLKQVNDSMPPFDGYVAVVIDTDETNHGGEVYAWMYEPEKKKEEAKPVDEKHCHMANVPEIRHYTGPVYFHQDNRVINSNNTTVTYFETPALPQYCQCGCRIPAANYLYHSSGQIYGHRCVGDRRRVFHYNRLFSAPSFGAGVIAR